MRTLVFGATGYVGGHVVARLAGAGRAVTGFARSAAGAQRVRALGAVPALGDIDDADFVLSLAREHDTIIWAAQLMVDHEQRFISALLAALEGSGKTLVFISGTGVLSERTDGFWSEKTFAEDEPFEPRRQLIARVESERLVRAASQRGVRTFCVRPPLIWGDGVSSVIADLHHSARQTGSVCYLGPGLNGYSNVHIEDLVDLIELALEKGVSGALYHCVSGEVNFRMMAQTIAQGLGLPARSIDLEEAERVWGRAALLIVFAASSRSRCPRARDELGWRPDPARLDFLGECLNPAFVQQAERGRRSWEPTSATSP
jgi:nucleoside-diphosphate-sugar epimerase